MVDFSVVNEHTLGPFESLIRRDSNGTQVGKGANGGRELMDFIALSKDPLLWCQNSRTQANGEEQWEQMDGGRTGGQYKCNARYVYLVFRFPGSSL